jgi:hypothetical protein
MTYPDGAVVGRPHSRPVIHEGMKTNSNFNHRKTTAMKLATPRLKYLGLLSGILALGAMAAPDQLHEQTLIVWGRMWMKIHTGRFLYRLGRADSGLSRAAFFCRTPVTLPREM